MLLFGLYCGGFVLFLFWSFGCGLVGWGGMGLFGLGSGDCVVWCVFGKFLFFFWWVLLEVDFEGIRRK